ncbi:hypothetical protein [Streptomyces turgidiscabies]|uniref:hypothetical protein n=1 Tax=Streptomyces turgidiscabies TaxID=85558 RepID=UPI0038F7DE84
MTDSADMITPETADELRRLYAIARTVNGATPLDDPRRQTSVDYTRTLQMLVDRGITAYRLAKTIGVRPGAIRQRLARHGHRAPMPSAAHKAYRGITTATSRRAGQ